jgi:hypothetical protein
MRKPRIYATAADLVVEQLKGAPIRLSDAHTEKRDGPALHYSAGPISPGGGPGLKGIFAGD